MVVGAGIGEGTVLERRFNSQIFGSIHKLNTFPDQRMVRTRRC